MSFNIQEFRANIDRNNGLAKPSKFKVNIVLPQTLQRTISSLLGGGGKGSGNTQEALSLQCEVAELPGKSFVTEDVKIYGPTYKIPFQTQYNDINITLLSTGTFFERNIFDQWLEFVMPSSTNNMRFRDDYLTTIYISQYDEVGNEIYKVKLIDAFPINIQAQPLNWSDDGFHRLTVVFSYLRYETEVFGVKSDNRKEYGNNPDGKDRSYESPYIDEDAINYDENVDGRIRDVEALSEFIGEDYKDRPDGVTRELVNHPALPGYKAVAAFGQSDTANQIPAGVPLDYRGGHDGGDNPENPKDGKDYLGGNDRGDNPEDPKDGKDYQGSGFVSGLLRAAATGIVFGLIANARRTSGGNRGTPVGQNYADRGTSTPPGGKPYGEQ